MKMKRDRGAVKKCETLSLATLDSSLEREPNSVAKPLQAPPSRGNANQLSA